MKVLAIGNSFSQDATRYLHQIAESQNVELEVVNLCMGGCPLEWHHDNMVGDKRNYMLEYNGKFTGFYVTMKEALESREWDVITLQQVSHYSPKIETYYPYVTEIVKYIRSMQPKARLLIHETWAYEIDSTHGAFHDYNCDQQYMYKCLRNAYHLAAEKIGAELITCGDAVQYIRETLPEFDYAGGGLSLNRDGFHMTQYIGRCLLAYVWIEKVLGADVTSSDYVPEDADEISSQLIPVVRNAVHSFMIV
jgi:hypothetical protein